MKKLLIMAGVAAVMAACTTGEKEYDATGTFEATETTVSAEQSGRLLTFDIEEGDSVVAGREVGLIDTTQLWLKIQQLQAQLVQQQSTLRIHPVTLLSRVLLLKAEHQLQLQKLLSSRQLRFQLHQLQLISQQVLLQHTMTKTVTRYLLTLLTTTSTLTLQALSL